ncbi:MAG: 30S ribosomal protein S6 [Chitinophagales bacterium]
MQQSYENVLVFTPVLTEEEVKHVVGDYQKLLKSHGADIVHEDFWGLKQLAYPIRKKTTGFYLVTEFKADSSSIAKLELQYKRDERVLRFLTTKLDKYSLEYNEKKRLGLIGRNKKTQNDKTA